MHLVVEMLWAVNVFAGQKRDRIFWLQMSIALSTRSLSICETNKKASPFQWNNENLR